MKRILTLTVIAISAMFLCSCEDFLDSTNYWSKTTDDFPKSETDADQLIVAIYSNLNLTCGGDYVAENYYLWANCAADDCLGGGGANDQMMQAEDLMLSTSSSQYDNFYKDRYKGVARCNLAIEQLENCGLSADKYNQYMGEAYFMRAYFMYELGSMFGNIPYPTSTQADATQPQIGGEELWGQILEDIKNAVELMPAKKKSDGHADKYCAQALLGRVYLFASGFLGVSSFNTPDGSTIDKDYVAKQIADCVASKEYDLVPEYHNLWAYTNRCTVEDELSPWKGMGYSWADNDNKLNPEAMFKIKFNCQSSWGTVQGFTNQMALYMGVRGQSGITSDGTCFPFGTGWGMCPVSAQFVADWKAIEPNDPRLDASVINISAWSKYDLNADTHTQATGYYQTKVMPVIARDTKGGASEVFWNNYANEMYDLTWYDGSSDDFQLTCSIADLVLIRFAEVLLMDAELNNSQESFNRVRDRAKLPTRTLNEENLRNERRWELAFEAVRFNDLRRYGDQYAMQYLDKQEGQPIYCSGTLTTNNASKYNGGYGNRYSQTHGFVRIPENEIALSSGSGEEYTYVQNAGWIGSGFEYAGW